VKLVLQTASGKVERLRDGEWVPASAGESVEAGEHVRTADSEAIASLNLQQADASARIGLAGGSQIGVRPGTSGLRLVSGVIKVSLSAGASYRVEARGGQAATGNGVASLLYSGARLSALCTSGLLEIESQGRKVAVPAGSFLSVRDREAPPAPGAPPAQVTIAVENPAKDAAGKTATLSGTVSGPATVTVAGAPVSVDAEGRFTTTVVLKPGKNAFAAVARDISGNQSETKFAPIEVAAPRPAAAGGPEKKGAEVIQWGNP
jgi:hypothetical protein